MIKEETSSNEKEIEHIKTTLFKASADEVERVYDMFYRFGVKASLENLGSLKKCLN